MANVQQTTIKPIIKTAVVESTLVHTDEYSIYARLPAWGYQHKTVCHGCSECARDEDGDGLCEVHVNTIEGFWSLLRSWLRPHRGISQEKQPLYLASRPGGFHPRALLEPCLNLSVHTAPDVRPLTCSTRQCANRAGSARCIRANQSRAPFGHGRRRLYLFRAQRIR